MSSDPTGPEEIKDHLNFVERLLDGADSSDEYLEAIVRNQAVMIGLMENGGSNVPEIGLSGVPQDTAGIVIEGASEGDFADFLYKDDGRTVVTEFEAARDVTQGEVATVNDDGNIIPAGGVEQADLDFGNVGSQLGDATNFIYGSTPENVTLGPGDEEVVLEVATRGKAGLRLVGTNDEQETFYQYLIDGEALLDEAIPAPLGLYNNMFEFPTPLEVEQKFEVKVIRPENASGPNDYYSNAVIQ